TGTLGLRGAYSWLVDHQRQTALRFTPKIGFSDTMDLGALDGMIESDAVVLRIKGAHLDYLRGAVLDFYVAGRWSRSDAATVETEQKLDETLVPRGALDGPGSAQVMAVSEGTDRFFLPLEARSVVTAPAAVAIDRMGAVRRVPKRGLESARFVTGERDR